MNPQEVVERYLGAQLVRGLADRTLERRRWSLTKYIAHLDGTDLATAPPEALESFLARYPSAQSRQSIRSDINQLYQWMMLRGHAQQNPCDLVDPPRVPTRAPTPVPAADVLRAIAASSPTTRLMIMLASYEGLRTFENAACRGEHVDRRAGIIVVPDGKGGSGDTVPLAREVADELKHWPARGPLFPGVDRHGVYSRIKHVFNKLDIPHRPHDLRHSFGTETARKTKGDLMAVSQLMRHKTVNTTQRYVRYHAPGAEIVTGLFDPGTPFDPNVDDEAA